jgi:molybdopterin synthase catalytic subunit/molybdopterin converting factor small subunit
MLVSVRLFAGLRERAGSGRIEVELPDEGTVGDLLAALELAPRSCVAAVNREYADAATRIAPGDEVALVPPVSGGAAGVTVARVSSGPLDPTALLAAVRDPAAGAVVLFEGVTREVDALEYEAYVEMAEARLAAIAEEEAVRHGLCAVAVEHRTGSVALGEPSVLVAVSAAHRGEAFAGARAVIDRVKAEAPIWKVEVSGADRQRVEGTLPPV